MCFKSLHTVRAPSNLREFGAYALGFTQPSGRGKLDHLFTPEKIRNQLKTDASFAGNAGEFLSVCPIWHRYLEKVAAGRGHCKAQIDSLLALCELVELLQA